MRSSVDLSAISRSCLVLSLAWAALPAVAQSPAEARQPNTLALTFKTGDVRLIDDSQSISTTDRTFDAGASGVWGVELETRLPAGAQNLSIGGEVLLYKNNFRKVTSSGPGFEDTMYTSAFLAKTKYYFLPGSPWQPYAGAGIGTVWSHDFTGPIHGIANGFAYQAVVGMQLRSERVGMRVEYMVLSARLKDDQGERIDASSRGLFAGFCVYFGRR